MQPAASGETSSYKKKISSIFHVSKGKEFSHEYHSFSNALKISSIFGLVIDRILIPQVTNIELEITFEIKQIIQQSFKNNFPFPVHRRIVNNSNFRRISIKLSDPFWFCVTDCKKKKLVIKSDFQKRPQHYFKTLLNLLKSVA